MGTRDRVILALLFGGFVTFVLEVRFEHRFVVETTWQGWIPIVYSGLGAVACLIGMSNSKAARVIASSIFFVGLVVSGIGLYFHTNYDVKKFEKFLQPDKTIYESKKAADGREVEVHLDKPLAAPLGIAGLSSIAFILTSGLFKPKKGG